MPDDIFKALVDNFNVTIRELRKNPEQAYETLKQGFTHKSSAVREILPRALFESKAITNDNRDDIVMWFIDRLLHDTNNGVRETMANRLTTMSNYYRKRHDFISEAIGTGLDSENDKVRAATLLVLQTYFSNNYLHRFLEMIENDPNELVRARAVVNVAQPNDWYEQFMALGDKGKNGLLMALNDPVKEVQAKATKGLLRFQEPSTFDVLVDFISQDDLHPYVKLQTIAAIKNLTGRGITTDKVFKNLTEGNATAQRSALEIYGSVSINQGQATLDAILPYLDNDDPKLRELAAVALVNSKNPSVIEDITQAIIDGRVPFGTVAKVLSESSRISEANAIAARVNRESTDDVRKAVGDSNKSHQAYLDRMRRLY